MVEQILEDLCHCMFLECLRRVCSSRLFSGRKVACAIPPILQVRFDVYTFLSLSNQGLSSPAGAHPSGMIGEDPIGQPRNLLPLLAHIAIRRAQDAPLRVFGNDYPTL